MFGDPLQVWHSVTRARASDRRSQKLYGVLSGGTVAPDLGYRQRRPCYLFPTVTFAGFYIHLYLGTMDLIPVDLSPQLQQEPEKGQD